MFINFVSCVLLFNLPSGLLIHNPMKNTSQFQHSELGNNALESRQNYHPYPLNHSPSPNYYGLLQYPQKFDYDHREEVRPAPLPRPVYHTRPGQNYINYRPPESNPQSIMDVLFSIAQNDKLRCVPRLLCELTSDTLSSQSRQMLGFLPSSLPINLNMNSAIGLLSVLDRGDGAPIPTFAKAAILGYISKGNADSCINAYPECPRDADKLVQYLNNYNGGFFRFFSGVQNSANYNPHYPNYQNYPHNSMGIQNRIQNKPGYYAASENSNTESFTFPNDHPDSVVSKKKPQKSLAFPVDDLSEYNEFTFRKPKELPYTINHYHTNKLDFQKPLLNHKATPMVFPDRTGTGDLRLDPEELNENYKQTRYNLQNNNFISFNPFPTNEGFYYRVPEGVSYNIPDNKDIFSFPL